MKHEGGKIPASVIRRVIERDPFAIEAVLEHYEPYICALSLRTTYHADGQVTTAVDEDMKSRLRAKLTEGLFKFQVSK